MKQHISVELVEWKARVNGELPEMPGRAITRILRDSEKLPEQVCLWAMQVSCSNWIRDKRIISSHNPTGRIALKNKYQYAEVNPATVRRSPDDVSGPPDFYTYLLRDWPIPIFEESHYSSPEPTSLGVYAVLQQWVTRYYDGLERTFRSTSGWREEVRAVSEDPVYKGILDDYRKIVPQLQGKPVTPYEFIRRLNQSGHPDIEMKISRMGLPTTPETIAFFISDVLAHSGLSVADCSPTRGYKVETILVGVLPGCRGTGYTDSRTPDSETWGASFMENGRTVQRAHRDWWEQLPFYNPANYDGRGRTLDNDTVRNLERLRRGEISKEDFLERGCTLKAELLGRELTSGERRKERERLRQAMKRN